MGRVGFAAQAREVPFGIIPTAGVDHGVDQVEAHLSLDGGIGARREDSFAYLQSPERLPGQRPRREQQPVGLDGAVRTRTKRQCFGRGQRSLTESSSSRVEPQFGGADHVTGYLREVGGELAEFPLQARMEGLKRLRQLGADELPFFGKQGFLNGLYGEGMTEPVRSSGRVDQLSADRLAERSDRVLGRVSQGSGNQVPVELAAQHRRVADELSRAIRQ